MKKFIAPIFIFLVLVNLSLVLAIPASPHGFYGTAKYSNGVNIPDGYIVTGEVNGVVTGSSVISDGIYDLVVVDDIGEGGIVKFYIQGKETKQIYNFESFEVTELDLTIDNILNDDDEFCGDNVCNNGESCSSCSIDCNPCETSSSSSSGSSGGSSGGSGGSSSSGSYKITQAKQDDGTINLNVGQDKKNSSSEEKQVSWINAKVIGGAIEFAKSKTGLGFIFALIIFIAGMFVVRLKKKKSLDSSEIVEEDSITDKGSESQE